MSINHLLIVFLGVQINTKNVKPQSLKIVSFYKTFNNFLQLFQDRQPLDQHESINLYQTSLIVFIGFLDISLLWRPK